MRWKWVPCCWPGMAEATFTELRSRRSFDVVRCFGRPQVSATAGSYWLNSVDQVLRCSTCMNQVHQQAEFEPDSASHWKPVELIQCRCHVVTKTEVKHQTSCNNNQCDRDVIDVLWSITLLIGTRRKKVKLLHTKFINFFGFQSRRLHRPAPLVAAQPAHTLLHHRVKFWSRQNKFGKVTSSTPSIFSLWSRFNAKCLTGWAEFDIFCCRDMPSGTLVQNFTTPYSVPNLKFYIVKCSFS